MNGRKVEELQRAIGTLTQQELEELRLWLDEYAGPSPLDRRIQADLATGRLDQTALDDEKRGRVGPLHRAPLLRISSFEFPVSIF